MKKTFKRFLSVFLAVLMVITVIPMGAYAAETEETEAVQVSELEDSRDLYSKTYETSEDTNVVISAAVPLHYEENGELKDIDNTLVKSETDSSVLTNTANAYNVELPNKYTDDSEIKLDYEDNSISFKLLNDVKPSKGNITEAEKADVDETDAESVAYAESNIDKLSSSITYENIMPDTDFEYDVQPDALKENIILNKIPDENYKIQYELNVGNLEAVLNDDNSISIIDNKKNEIFSIDAPYMIDAKENVSENITVSLEKSETGYILTYTPDYSWLSSDDTAYPVTIDPTVTVVGDKTTKNIEDTFVTSSTKSKNKSTMTTVQIQNSTVQSWGYYNIKNLPVLPKNARITNCRLNLSTTTDVSNAYQLALYALNSSAEIDSTYISKVNWNNKIEPNDTIIDLSKTPNTPNQIYFDITNLTNLWYQNSNLNRILTLKALNGNLKTSIASSEYTTDVNKLPYISLEYTIIAGINNDNKYHTQDAGLLGTAYINDYTGKLIFERTEFTSNGSAGDITLYIGEGVNTPTDNSFGENISVNYYQTLIEDKLNENSEYILTKGDGSKEYITSGDKYTIDKSIENKIIISYFENNNLIKNIFSSAVNSQNTGKDSSEMVYSLIEYSVAQNYENNTNTAPSVVTVNYNDDKILSIEDEINSYEFEYTNGKLSGISATPSYDEESLLIENCNGVGYLQTSYSYSKNILGIESYINDSELITQHVEYVLNNGNIEKATDENNLSYKYTYNDNNQVIKVQEFAGETSGDYLTFEYGNNTTTISDSKNTYTEYFDLAGNLESIVDQDGNATFAQYKDNLISKVSKTRNSARNIADFYNFENVKDCVFTPENKDGFDVSLTNEQSFNGSSSVKLVNNTNGEGFFSKILSNLEKDSTYTISMWVYLENASTKCKLTLENSLNIGTETHAYSQNKAGWQQLSCTINTENSDSPIIKVKLETDNSGISTSDIKPVYVDNMYIQKSPYLTNVNLLQNGDFSNGKDIWSTDNNDSVAIENEDANISTADNNRLKITGDYLSENSISQTVSITANARGTKYTYGGWIKSVDTLPEKEGTNREISLSVYGIASDGTASLLDKTTYSSYLSNWQYVESELILPNDDIKKLKFVASNNYQTGYVMFDGLSLSQDELYTIEFEYDENNEVKSIIANGSTISLSEEDDDNGDNNAALNTSYEYDNFGNITKLTDTATADNIAQTIVSKFEYGNNGSLLTKQSNDVGKWINYKYDYFGNVASVIDANGNKVEYEYDNFQNLSAVINQFKYDHPVSGSDTEDSPKNWSNEDATLKVQYSYTGNRLDKIETGNVENSEFSATNTLSFEYDKWGNVSNIFINNTEEPYIHYAYNEKDSEQGKTDYHQLSSVTYANGQKIHYEYDKNDNIIYEYDSDNKDGDTLSYSYFYYDDGTCYGKKNLITGTVETYQDGITTQKDADGNIIHSYGYDSDGRLYEIIGDDSITTSVANTNSNGIDTSTQNTVVNGNENVISQETDQFGRVLTQKVKMGEKYLIKKYTYFSANELNESEDNNSNETTYSVKSIKYFLDSNINEPIYTFEYTYDDNGNISTETTDNSAEDENVTLTYSYNDSNMLTAVDSRENEYGGRFDINMIFKYDSQGNVIHWKRDYRTSGNSDWMNIRYSSDDTGTYIDNVVSEFPYEHDNWNISHDKMGNLLSMKQTKEKEYFTYDDCQEIKYNWKRGNVLSNMSVYNLPDGDSNSPILKTSANYEYDDNNIRTKKEFVVSDFYANDDSESELNGNVQYFWRDGLLTGEYVEYSGYSMKESNVSGESIDNSGSYKTTILYDQNNNAYGFILTKLKDADGNSVNETNTYYYLKDMNNTVMAIVDENGQIRISYENVPYGLANYQAHNFGDKYLSILNPLAYRDYIFDHESDMFYLQSRYYMPTLCRFISADNLLDTESGNAMSTNLYSYCENNPIMYSDPTGMFSVPRDVLSIALDIAFDALIPAAAGSVNVIGRSLQMIMKGSKTVSKVVKVISKLKGGYVTRVKGIYSSFYTAIRKGIARATGYTISTAFGLAVNRAFSSIVNKLTRAKFVDQVKIITCFFSLGGWVALLIDATDGSLNEDCKLW